MSWLQAVDTTVTLALALGAATWAAVKVRRRREHFPRIEFTVEVDFAVPREQHWLVSLDAFIVNKGFVRYSISDFAFEIRYARATETLSEGGREIGFQTQIPHVLKSGNWLTDTGGRGFVDPGLSTRYSYVATVPADAEFLLIHGLLTFGEGGRRYAHTAERLIRVPDLERARAAA
jgi:hypothetical protein